MADRIDLLVAALRSGRYRQGTEYLRDPYTGCFCVEGVMCDLYIKAGNDAKWELTLDEFNNIYTLRFRLNGDRFSSEDEMPLVVSRWFGMRDVFRIDRIMGPLSMFNDKGMTFEQFANLFEGHPQEIFPIVKED